MGVSRLQPVLTRHGQVARVNTARMRANAIEAAEQCGILSPAGDRASRWRSRVSSPSGTPARWLVFCDEDAEVANPVAALRRSCRASPLAVLVGPEGGFAEDERAALLRLPNVVRLCARSAHSARRYRGGRGAGARSGGARRLALSVRRSAAEGAGVRSVDHPRLVDADEADVVAVAAMDAGDMRQPAPARAMSAPSAGKYRFDRRRVGNDAAGVVAGEPGPGPSKIAPAIAPPPVPRSARRATTTSKFRTHRQPLPLRHRGPRA